jgi:hypothetical protein
MKRLIDLVKLDRMDRLIRRHATGSPQQLAKRLEMSRSNLFELIAFLRDRMGAPIVYSKSCDSYVYEYVPNFYLGFDKERLSSAELNGAYGGGSNDEIRITNTNNMDSDEVILDDDINFNELYMDDY